MQGKQPAFKVSLKGKALRLLSQREHTRKELERKLAHHEEEAGELAKALDELQGLGFLDEQRAAESLLNRRAQGLGASRLRQEMQSKGLAREVIEQTFADAGVGTRESEYERALAVWQRKFEAIAEDVTPEERAKQKARQMRFLLARGFSGDVARRVVDRREPSPP
jgi:regulatory protein